MTGGASQKTSDVKETDSAGGRSCLVLRWDGWSFSSHWNKKDFGNKSHKWKVVEQTTAIKVYTAIAFFSFFFLCHGVGGLRRILCSKQVLSRARSAAHQVLCTKHISCSKPLAAHSTPHRQFYPHLRDKGTRGWTCPHGLMV